VPTDDAINDLRSAICGEVISAAIIGRRGARKMKRPASVSRSSGAFRRALEWQKEPRACRGARRRSPRVRRRTPRV